jgi:hypothetical protein
MSLGVGAGGGDSHVQSLGHLAHESGEGHPAVWKPEEWRVGSWSWRRGIRAGHGYGDTEK